MRSSIPDELIITDCTATDISFFCTAIRIIYASFQWPMLMMVMYCVFVYLSFCVFFLCFNSWSYVSLIENNNVCNKPVSWYAHVYHKTKALFNSSSDIPHPPHVTWRWKNIWNWREIAFSHTFLHNSPVSKEKIPHSPPHVPRKVFNALEIWSFLVTFVTVRVEI